LGGKSVLPHCLCAKPAVRQLFCLEVKKNVAIRSHQNVIGEKVVGAEG